jgi:hypothetical protein
MFEKCLPVLYLDHLMADDSQFAFNRRFGMHELNVFFARKSVHAIVNGGVTPCMAALDTRKTFLRVNHKAMLQKLLDWGFPSDLIDLQDNWLKRETSLKSNGLVFYRIAILVNGLNQGSVLRAFDVLVSAQTMSLSRVINFILRYNCTQTICF